MEKMKTMYTVDRDINFIVYPLWKTVEISQKIKNRTPHDSAIWILGIYPKKTKILTQKDICTMCLLKQYL